MTIRRVIVESPFRGRNEDESARNQRYLAACLRDCVKRNETPYASHRILTMPGVLDDAIEEERNLGIELGFAWREVAHVTAFYVDLGWSGGMLRGWADVARLAVTTRGHISEIVDFRAIWGPWTKYGLTNQNAPGDIMALWDARRGAAAAKCLHGNVGECWRCKEDALGVNPMHRFGHGRGDDK